MSEKKVKDIWETFTDTQKKVIELVIAKAIEEDRIEQKKKKDIRINNKWKPVEKSLPSKPGEYFVTRGLVDGKDYIVYSLELCYFVFTPTGYEWISKDEKKEKPLMDVIAWMDVPKPYDPYLKKLETFLDAKEEKHETL